MEDLERAARSRCRRGLSGSGVDIAEEEEDGVGGTRGGSGDWVFESEKVDFTGEIGMEVGCCWMEAGGLEGC